MARPSHDIPNLLLGGIRDYADENDISSEEAHRRLLRRALKEVGILSCKGIGPVAGEETGDDGTGDEQTDQDGQEDGSDT